LRVDTFGCLVFEPFEKAHFAYIISESNVDPGRRVVTLLPRNIGCLNNIGYFTAPLKDGILLGVDRDVSHESACRGIRYRFDYRAVVSYEHVSAVAFNVLQDPWIPIRWHASVYAAGREGSHADIGEIGIHQSGKKKRYQGQ